MTIAWVRAEGDRRPVVGSSLQSRIRDRPEPFKGRKVAEMNLWQAEELLGEDVVIGRAITWRMSTYLCQAAAQCDPAEYWAYAVWDDAKRDWIEPTLVFRRLSDLVAHCQSKVRPGAALPETSPGAAPR